LLGREKVRTRVKRFEGRKFASREEGRGSFFGKGRIASQQEKGSRTEVEGHSLPGERLSH